ncbi:MAG: chemotaxis protein CheW [Anaerovoracaceae bacterium]|jgi:chemotaxis signal transduction protein
MIDKEENLTENQLYVCVRLKDQVYALDAAKVESIFEIKDKITPLPEANRFILGVILLRGEVLSLLDLRKLLNIESMEEEHKEFVDMLNQRKNEHVQWVDALKHSVETGETFTLAIDHRDCAFGQWYDKYESPNQTIQMRFNRIGEPHRAIHESAIKVFSHKDKEAQHNVINNITIPAMKNVIKSIDDMIEEFIHTQRSLCVAISDGNDKIGVVVDEVLSVEELADMKFIDKEEQDRIAPYVATSRAGDNVLIINDSRIMEIRQ